MDNQFTNGDSSRKMWYLIGVLVVVVLALWYFYGMQAPAAQAPTTVVESVEIPDLSSGDATTDISADLEATPDISSELDAEAASAAQEIKAL